MAGCSPHVLIEKPCKDIREKRKQARHCENGKQEKTCRGTSSTDSAWRVYPTLSIDINEPELFCDGDGKARAKKPKTEGARPSLDRSSSSTLRNSQRRFTSAVDSRGTPPVGTIPTRRFVSSIHTRTKEHSQTTPLTLTPSVLACSLSCIAIVGLRRVGKKKKKKTPPSSPPTPAGPCRPTCSRRIRGK